MVQQRLPVLSLSLHIFHELRRIQWKLAVRASIHVGIVKIAVAHCRVIGLLHLAMMGVVVMVAVVDPVGRVMRLLSRHVTVPSRVVVSGVFMSIVVAMAGAVSTRTALVCSSWSLVCRRIVVVGVLLVVVVVVRTMRAATALRRFLAIDTGEDVLSLQCGVTDGDQNGLLQRFLVSELLWSHMGGGQKGVIRRVSFGAAAVIIAAD